MTLALKVLLRVVRSRVERGEKLDTILEDYPKLTEKERDQILAELGNS